MRFLSRRARQAGLCSELVYSWIVPAPEIKAALSQSFGSPVSDLSSPPAKGDTVKDLLLLQLFQSEGLVGVPALAPPVAGKTEGCIAFLSHQTRAEERPG